VSPEALGRRAAESALFQQALTPPSTAHGSGEPSNQRLEFLGDAVLYLAVADLLYRKFPDLPEGDLSRIRIALVREETLARRARDLGLGGLLRIAPGERRAGLETLPSVLCDTYEAVLGAVYLEDGFAAACDFVAADVARDLDDLLARPWLSDPKSWLQEILYKRLGRQPQYRVAAASGPTHRPRYEVVVSDGTTELGRGSGPNKRAAEEAAARAALEARPEWLAAARPGPGRLG
jgi:ribonuclease-3